jgi:hypothetical protein
MEMEATVKYLTFVFNVLVQEPSLLSETLGIRHVSEIGIFRISEW